MRLSRAALTTRKPPRAPRPAWKCAEDYKRWLRKLPCACCGKLGTTGDPVVAAHVDIAGGKGAGTKVADQHCVPLADSCHVLQHSLGWLTFEKRLPGASAVSAAAAYWSEWPGRRDWERDLEARAALGPMRGRA